MIDIVDDVIRFELARELIIEADGSGSDEQTKYLLDAAKGNPWDCGPLFVLLTLTKKEFPK